MERIEPEKKAGKVTDCLSRRLQFKQLLPYEVIHPIELLKELYTKHKTDKS
ncbi:hypothetical protein D1BOALGB6SA_7448 [Olavius sp. associated proteobacterium Delta 1]|nr:hypothetical protein D1BOALGB6SA_7448 [Olavius sp. associated proteobacterium Delta 1]